MTFRSASDSFEDDLGNLWGWPWLHLRVTLVNFEGDLGQHWVWPWSALRVTLVSFEGYLGQLWRWTFEGNQSCDLYADLGIWGTFCIFLCLLACRLTFFVFFFSFSHTHFGEPHLKLVEILPCNIDPFKFSLRMTFQYFLFVSSTNISLIYS